MPLPYPTDDTRKAHGWWGVVTSNWCFTNRSLRLPLAQPQGRRQYCQRTPAMAAGLADHIWSVEEVMRYPLYPR
jgi:hypothetical protein